MQHMSIEEEAQELATSLIESIKKVKQVDYTEHFDLIAFQISEYVFNGNWDHTISINGLPDLRLIQEDEYDQSMDEDEQPQDAYYFCGYYIVLEG